MSYVKINKLYFSTIEEACIYAAEQEMNEVSVKVYGGSGKHIETINTTICGNYAYYTYAILKACGNEWSTPDGYGEYNTIEECKKALRFADRGLYKIIRVYQNIDTYLYSEDIACYKVGRRVKQV